MVKQKRTVMLVAGVVIGFIVCFLLAVTQAYRTAKLWNTMNSPAFGLIQVSVPEVCPNIEATKQCMEKCKKDSSPPHTPCAKTADCQSCEKVMKDLCSADKNDPLGIIQMYEGSYNRCKACHDCFCAV